MNKTPIAYHPGETLLEEIEARGWSQTQFSEILGTNKSEINNIIKGRRNITPKIALRIGAAFGTSAEVWMGLQNMYDFYILSQTTDEAKNVKKIQKKALAFA